MISLATVLINYQCFWVLVHLVQSLLFIFSELSVSTSTNMLSKSWISKVLDNCSGIADWALDFKQIVKWLIFRMLAIEGWSETGGSQSVSQITVQASMYIPYDSVKCITPSPAATSTVGPRRRPLCGCTCHHTFGVLALTNNFQGIRHCPITKFSKKSFFTKIAQNAPKHEKMQ